MVVFSIKQLLILRLLDNTPFPKKQKTKKKQLCKPKSFPCASRTSSTSTTYPSQSSPPPNLRPLSSKRPASMCNNPLSAESSTNLLLPLLSDLTTKSNSSGLRTSSATSTSMASPAVRYAFARSISVLTYQSFRIRTFLSAKLTNLFSPMT